MISRGSYHTLFQVNITNVYRLLCLWLARMEGTRVNHSCESKRQLGAESADCLQQWRGIHMNGMNDLIIIIKINLKE